MRTSKELIAATKPFAREIRWLSWWHLWSTIVAVAAFLAVAACPIHIGFRLVASVLGGLTLVRLFIIFHDFEHGSILTKSWLAKTVMTVFGVCTLNPPSVWKRSHDHHHRNNAKMFGANIGSYPVMSCETYRSSNFVDRMVYRFTRHPLNMLFGYFTVFMLGMCVRPFCLNPRKHIDAASAIVVHGIILTGAIFVGWVFLLLVVVLPLVIAGAMGAYLFYAQHNFPSVKLRTREDWSYVDAALHSSSYIRMNPIMAWFTGNIGYHHVHHLNAKIPFYRLPEAMASIQELQSPLITTLSPVGVWSCLRLQLWDPNRDRLVTFRDGLSNAVVSPDAELT